MTYPETQKQNWLTSNLRLAGLLAGLAVFLVAVSLVLCGIALRFAGGISLMVLLCAAVLGTLGGTVGAVAFMAKKERVFLDGAFVMVRTGPASLEKIPLDAVECFFLGSQPLDRAGEPVGAEDADFRVGTLVVRIAERFGDIASARRGPWAGWEDGYLVVDGRWSEPLVVETLRRINGRLAVAKRQPVIDRCASSDVVEGCCG